MAADWIVFLVVWVGLAVGGAILEVVNDPRKIDAWRWPWVLLNAPATVACGPALLLVELFTYIWRAFGGDDEA